MNATEDTKALLTRARQMLSEVYYPGRDEPYETIASLIKAVEALSTLQMQSEAVPVAYRWRYVRALGPDKTWTVCQTPRQARSATADWAGIEVEPLYLHPASQADLREALALLRDRLRAAEESVRMGGKKAAEGSLRDTYGVMEEHLSGLAEIADRALSGAQQ